MACSELHPGHVQSIPNPSWSVRNPGRVRYGVRNIFQHILGWSSESWTCPVRSSEYFSMHPGIACVRDGVRNIPDCILGWSSESRLHPGMEFGILDVFGTEFVTSWIASWDGIRNPGRLRYGVRNIFDASWDGIRNLVCVQDGVRNILDASWDMCPGRSSEYFGCILDEVQNVPGPFQDGV